MYIYCKNFKFAVGWQGRGITNLYWYPVGTGVNVYKIQNNKMQNGFKKNQNYHLAFVKFLFLFLISNRIIYN